jgi:hypothetical protein
MHAGGERKERRKQHAGFGKYQYYPDRAIWLPSIATHDILTAYVSMEMSARCSSYIATT